MDDMPKPAFSPVATAAPAKVIAFEEWARTKQTPAWQVKAAAVGKHWPLGKEMSETDFDEAIVDVTTHVSR